MSLSSVMVCSDLVTPGVAPVVHVRDRFSELMSELLPTFGYPTMPTVIAFLMLALRLQKE
jgi:hypothetical protein